MKEVMILSGAFIFGYCFTYCLFKRKKKNQKEAIECFFKNFEKKHDLQQSGSCRKNKRE